MKKWKQKAMDIFWICLMLNDQKTGIEKADLVQKVGFYHAIRYTK